MGWALIGGSALPILALQRSAPSLAVVLQLVTGALGVGLGAYWSATDTAIPNGSAARIQLTTGWVVAFVLASIWFWSAPASQASLDFQSSGGHEAQSFDEVTTAFEHRRSVLIGPANLVGAEVVFGLAGGLLTTLARRLKVRWVFPRALGSAIGWAVGAVVGGYAAFVGSYLLGAIGAVLLRPAPPVGASIGFAVAGWLGGSVAAYLGFATQKILHKVVT